MSISVLVASRNPVKVAAGQRALSQWFARCHVIAHGVSVDSGVSDQPMSESETRLGAVNRVKRCITLHNTGNQTADWTLAYEGGVDLFADGPATFAYVAISNGKKCVVGRSGNLLIPYSVFDALKQGEELGTVIDKQYGTRNIKQKGGAISILTHGLATRQSVYVTATLMAMSAFD